MLTGSVGISLITRHHRLSVQDREHSRDLYKCLRSEINHLFTQLFIDGHLFCFQSLVVRNKAEVSNFVHMSFCSGY